jgi:putative membrane protein
MTTSPRKPRAFDPGKLEQRSDEFTALKDSDPGTAGPMASKRNSANPAASAKRTAPRKPRSIGNKAEIEILPDEAVDEAYIDDIEELAPPPVPPPPRRRFSFAKLAVGAFSALIAMAAGLWIDSFVRDMFSRNDILGWVALGLAATGVLAVLAMVLREAWAISRLKQIEELRQRGEEARQLDDLKKARRVAIDIAGLFISRPDTAHGRAQLGEHGEDIMDGSDLIHLVERDLLAPLDARAREMVMNSAKRVSVVTAVSPRALVDVGYVLYENMRLIRAISEHYGGRPGTLGFWRLASRVVSHLAATGAIALGDGLMQQIIGHGVASRLSARLGEGVVNGLLTARVGISAIDVCRPLKFDAEKRPGVSDFISALTRSGSSKDREKQA